VKLGLQAGVAQLGDRELSGDRAVCAIDAGCQGAHACSGSKSDQGNYQDVFDEVLTVFLKEPPQIKTAMLEFGAQGTFLMRGLDSFAGRGVTEASFPPFSPALPQRNISLAWRSHRVPAGQQLRDGQLGRDVGERAIDAGGQARHCGGGGESDECNYQDVLDQVLAFVVLDCVDGESQLVDEVLHCGIFSPRLISQLATGVALYIATGVPNFSVRFFYKNQ
jgi:hypothetical protein